MDSAWPGTLTWSGRLKPISPIVRPRLHPVLEKGFRASPACGSVATTSGPSTEAEWWATSLPISLIANEGRGRRTCPKPARASGRTGLLRHHRERQLHFASVPARPHQGVPGEVTREHPAGGEARRGSCQDPWILGWHEPKDRGGGCRSPLCQIPQQTGAGLPPVTIVAPTCSCQPAPSPPWSCSGCEASPRPLFVQAVSAGCRSCRRSFVV